MVQKSTDKLLRLRVDRIAASPHQARRDFPESSIRALAESIGRHGLIAPVLVRPARDGYELVAGERRLRAVRLLGQSQIDALVVDAPARDAALLTLIENIQRENLHYLDEARAYRHLQETFGFTQQALAACLGVSQPTVSNRLRLLALPAQARALLADSELTERHARALLRIPDEDAQLRALIRARDERMSVKQLETLADKLRAQRPAKGHVRLYLRDHRLLVNAVLSAVKSLREAGVMATSRVVEKPELIEVIVSLPLTPRR